MQRPMVRSTSRAQWLSPLLVATVVLSACAGAGGGAGGGGGGGGGDSAHGSGPGCASDQRPAATSDAASPTAPAAQGSGSAAPVATESCAPGEDDQGSAVAYSENSGGGGAKNIVTANNRSDGRLLVRGAVQLNHISGPTVEPVNEARAMSSCTDCQTFAVALQINLIGRDATRVTPQNLAVALNIECTRCITVARALQYVYTVDDPNETPEDFKQLIREMEHELKRLDNERGITVDEAEARINDILARFRQLADSLRDERDETEEADTPSPSPTTSAAASASPSSSPDDSESAEPTESSAATDSAEPSNSPSTSP